MPGTKFYQMLYFIFIAIFSSISLSLPIELYLLIANFIPFVFLSRKRLVLHLEEKKEVGKNIFEYVFNSDMKLKFIAGQYLEWIIPHAGPDERGQRRFFTMSSAPNNDLNFLKLLVMYERENAALASVACKKLDGHLWYLSEELVGLAFFDDLIDH